MVTGSLASSLHGEPRSTHGLDIVIDPDRGSIEKLILQFSGEDYYVSREAALVALEDRGQFNVIDFETGWKVDFIIRKNRPFSREEFERRQVAHLFGVPVSMAIPEDVILAKLEWAKMSDSERQIRDVAGILQLKSSEIDAGYVEGWVGKLGVAVQWELAKEQARFSG
jgi:hypothetical protein